MRLHVLLAIAFSLIGCDSSTESNATGWADVTVTVLSASGQPVPATTVAIRCVDGDISTNTTTDGTGRFSKTLDVKLSDGKNHPTPVNFLTLQAKASP